MVGFAPGSAPLAARPPTPPKESSAKPDSANDTSVNAARADYPLVDTPDESPSSSAEYIKGTLERAQKKVGFSPWTEFHRLPVSGSKDSDSESSMRRLPPSKECKSLKSILKGCTDNTTFLSDTEMLAFDQTSFPAMLRSTIAHLANPSRASRLDAYTTLFACLSAYDEIPETKDLSEKAIEIVGYIRRDVSAKTGSDGNIDTQLVTQALKVLTIFLCTPSLAGPLPEDFCSFILDRSISSMEDTCSPKILVSHYMHLLEKQKFTCKHMTVDRVNRLLSALDVVTTRIKGNRIICHRLMIYQRLLLQSKSVMAARVGSWIENLISGMLSSIKDVRVRAIGFGVEAGLQLGTVCSVTQAFVEMCNRANPEGKKVVDLLCTRLGEITMNKEDGVHAPQIWSVVILFFRSRRRQLECWEHMKAWLIVIQRCLNCSDPRVKFQANIAWSRLIFVINPDTSTSASMTKMLRQPLVAHLERKASDKNSKQAKQVARSTYCTLLYYAFRPAATHAQLDQFWELYVAQIIPSSFAASKSDVNHAFDIMASLLSSCGKPKVWDENRANMNGPVKPEELPCLDPKWIRLRADRIVQIFDMLSDLADWRLGDDREASVVMAWRNFMTALGIASSKEVKVSMDAMRAVSTIINHVKHLLERRSKGLQNREDSQPDVSTIEDEADVYLKIAHLLQEAVTKIGTIPFMEKRMILTSQNAFEAAETPSSRSSRDSSSLNSPATHLLKLLLKSLPDQPPSLGYINTVKFVMHITLQSATNRRTQLVALRNLARLLLVDEASSKEASLVLWQLIAEATSLAIKLPQQNDPRDASPRPPGHEYREAVKILELGIQQRSVKTIDSWRKLHDCILDSLREEICDVGITLVMTEPLAHEICKNSNVCDEALLVTAAILLRSTHWPRSYQQMERAQNLLWGIGHTSPISYSLKPFDSVCSMVDKLLGSAYAPTMTLAAEAIGLFFSAVTTMIGSCPLEHQEFIVTQIQAGLPTWIEDANGLLSSPKPSLLTAVSLDVKKLWSTVLTVIENCPDHDTNLLFSIQHLLLSGLKSRHRSIINQCIVMWNRTFGCAEFLSYPEELQGTLLNLQCMTDIQLPAFPVVGRDQAKSPSPVHFIESPGDDVPSEDLPIARLPGRSETESHSRPNINAPQALVLSASPNLAGRSPLPARQGIRTTPKARLRHNDSQVRFAAIESSPLAPEPADSQVLTDRQKEVKERQGLEAAMFPEIRSSPKSASRPTEYSLPKLVFKPDHDQTLKPAMDEQISPMYPPDILMNDFLGSSPTPASSKKGTNGLKSLDGPPSSPPLIASDLEINRQVIAFAPFDLQGQLTPKAQGLVHGQSLNEIQANTERPSNARIDSSGIDESDNAIDHPRDSPVPATAIIQPGDRIMSDYAVLGDAPSQPIMHVPAVLPNHDISTVYNSFQIEGSSKIVSEDDQVAAQLISEMERASSQRSSKDDETRKPASRAASKRKNPFYEDANVQKRARRMSAPSNPVRKAQTPVAGQAVAECVMIDVRPAQVQLSASPVQVKRERSQSPSVMANIRPAREKSVSRKRRGRSMRKSRPSQLSQEASSIPSSPRQSRATRESDVDDAITANGSPNSTRKSARLSDAVTSSPPGSANESRGSETNSGRRKASKFWYYTTEESRTDAGANGKGSTSDTEDATVAARHNGSTNSQISEHQQQLSGQQHTIACDAQDHGRRARTSNDAKEGSQCEAAADMERPDDAPTAEGIVQGFRKMISSIKRVALGREDEREISKLLFQSMQELHEAGRRHAAM